MQTIPRKRLRKGYLQVYTGNGKGKTSAALGLALRAMGHGLKTYVGQFMKGRKYGELTACRALVPLIMIEQYGKEAFIHPGETPGERDRAMAREGLSRARSMILSGEFDIVILDEIITAYSFSLITLDDMLALAALRPESLELVLTGRGAPHELIDKADLVTEMKEIKHYYRQGVKARHGIES